MHTLGGVMSFYFVPFGDFLRHVKARGFVFRTSCRNKTCCKQELEVYLPFVFVVINIGWFVK